MKEQVKTFAHTRISDSHSMQLRDYSIENIHSAKENKERVPISNHGREILVNEPVDQLCCQFLVYLPFIQTLTM